MKSGRTLHPDDRISHYRVVAPLGAGGMGEVYLAQDQTLERSVALKVLPPELVRSEERVRRFVLEAKSASSLNHPNIVTIYEIGEDRVQPAGGAASDPQSLPVHFISMELVQGKTLSTLIHDDKIDVRTLLGYLVQAAEGLSKAHAAGIVHRDLKPGNIMVSSDGFAKVLDFGLTKLIEKGRTDPDLTSAPTEIENVTSEGAVLGTVGYMSPEQVQGKSVDHRTDIFSLGCIVYEAATRRRPFAAESGVETMHRILHDKPEPIEQSSPNVPGELRRLVRRALEKTPEQRLQSMKDLAIELREIVDEYDSLSASTGSGSTASMASIPAPARRRSWALVAGAALLIGAVGIVLGVIGIRRGVLEGPGSPFRSVRITTLSDRGDVNDAALSPDGRYVAFTGGASGQRGVWVRQVATETDIQVVPYQSLLPTNLCFSPDGSYLYYSAPDPERAGYWALFQIPTVGGPPRRRAYDVDSRISFSPDGGQVCFRRGFINTTREGIVILDLESNQERVLTMLPESRQIAAGPAWSPKGDRIAIAESDPLSMTRTHIVGFRVRDGRRDTLRSEPLLFTRALAWQPDGRGLVVAGFAPGSPVGSQISYVSYPDGRSRRITNDADAYWSLSVASSGKTIAAARSSSLSSLWTVQVDGRHDARQIVSGSSQESSVWNFEPAGSGTIVFSALTGQFFHLWTVAADGSRRLPLTSGRSYVWTARCAPGVVVYNQVDEHLTSQHVWRTDEAGGEPRQLTNGPGELLRDLSADGRLALYSSTERPAEAWTIPTTGGEAHRIPGVLLGALTFSPDARRVSCQTAQDEAGGRPGLVMEVVDVASGESTLVVLPPRAAEVRWAPDGRSLTFRDEADSAFSLFRQPIDGGPPVRIARLAEGRITGYRWSPDGTRLLLRQRTPTAANLWVANADGTGAEPLTDFKTGRPADMKWAPDGHSVVFTYGIPSQDVVLVRSVD